MQSAGDDLISIAASDPAAAQALAKHLRDKGDWIDVVAGIEFVVVRFDLATTDRSAAEDEVRHLVSSAPTRLESPQQSVVISVVYGGEYGPDLEFVCQQLGMAEQEFIALHCGEYTVDMLGFIPGFAYIGGLDERLIVDRLAEPRQFVAAGSVGIAGGRSGLYSLPGPGGWPLIGRTSYRLFDASAPEPFALAPGMTVVFEAVESL